jgi:anti-sigma-K factor RskA
MSLQDMIEMAILDVMGLLDEREQSAFEAAFRTASPAVQSQVRREQTRLSRIEALLPEVTPPSGLRAAVLEAVRSQIAMAEKSDERLFVPAILKSRGVAPFWRAAALGLAAAAVVLAVTTFQWEQQYHRLSDSLQDGGIFAEMQKQYGATYVNDVLFSQDTKRVLIKPVAAGFKGEASVFLNPEWKSAKFFGQAITTEDGHEYRLALIDDKDQVVQVLDTISSDGRLFSKNVSLAANASGTIAIVTAVGGEGQPPVILGKADLAS